MFLTKRPFASPWPASPRGSRAVGARRSVACSGSSPTTAASCSSARSASRQIPEEFVGNARQAGATPLREWIGNDAATVFGY
jgi:hypothetical protein